MAQATKAAQSTAKQRRAAAERTWSMFAHLAPEVSLADDLIADRRAEAQVEERAEAQRLRGSSERPASAPDTSALLAHLNVPPWRYPLDATAC